MTSLRLINPSKAYEASYRSLLEEFGAQGERLIPFPLSFPHENFPELIARLEENSKGLGLPDGFVAQAKDLGLAKVLLTCGKANLGIRGVRSEEERGSAKILDRPSVA